MYTDGSRRVVALPQAVTSELRRIRAEQDEQRRLLGPDYHDHGLVFAQANGKPLHVGNMLRRDFHPTAKSAGVPRARFHDAFRHGHATYCALAGVGAKVTAERLGHATAGFTLDVYTTVLAGQQADAARAVEALLLGSDPVMSNDEQNGSNSAN